MANANWGLYDEDDENIPEKPVKGNTISINKFENKKNKNGVNWGLYDDEDEKDDLQEKPSITWAEKASSDNIYQAYKSDEKTPEELKKMSVSERMQYAEDLKNEREYLQSAGFTKSALSELTFGASEHIDLLKPQEHELNQGLGSMVGMTAPLGLIGAILKPAVKIAKGTKLGSKIMSSSGLVENLALTGATQETGKQLIKGEGLNSEGIAVKGLEFGALGLLFEAVPAAWNWLKKLSPSKQAKILVDGTIPPDLPPTEYKVFQDKVVPALRKAGEAEYEAALSEATENTNAAFEQKMANVRAKHEADLYELSQKKQTSQETIENSKKQYQNKLKQIAAEHEAELSEIESANKEAMQEYETSKQEWERTKSRQQAVENAIKNIPEETPESLSGRVSKEGEDIGIRPKPLHAETETLKDKVGSIISKDKIKNTYDAGIKNVKAVRASDEADYKVVKDLYKKSEELNNKVTAEQPNLANELHQIVEEISAIPNPSPPQKEVLKTAEKTLDALIEFNTSGEAVGFKPVNNKLLLEQAKALRYSMDYDFSHGDARRIFNPLIEALQDAAEAGAISSGNESAVLANKVARKAHSEWATLYRNDYIKTYRNQTNHRSSQIFESSLNVDDFIQLDKVLSRTNAGQQLSNQTRRELIIKKLNPFLENPRKANYEKFDEVLNELSPILKPGEEQSIRNTFNQSKKTPVMQASKKGNIESPEKPKPKTIEKVNIPTYKAPKKTFKEITEVKIPLKPKVQETPAMKLAAKKMNIETEEAIGLFDTPTGIKQVRNDLTKTEPGRQLFREIGKEKIKKILFQGKVKQEFTGSELYNALNKAENFDVISEIIGEEAATDLLEAASVINKKRMTVNGVKKYAKKIGTVKAALLFGII